MPLVPSQPGDKLMLKSGKLGQTQQEIGKVHGFWANLGVSFQEKEGAGITLVEIQHVKLFLGKQLTGNLALDIIELENSAKALFKC